MSQVMLNTIARLPPSIHQDDSTLPELSRLSLSESDDPPIGHANHIPEKCELSESNHSITEIYSKAVSRRLSPFFNGKIDVLTEQQNEEKEKSGERECFLTATQREFKLLCPDIPFDTNQLLKKYIKFAIRGLNYRHGVSHNVCQDKTYVESLNLAERARHIRLATFHIKKAVLRDFEGVSLKEDQLQLRIKKQLEKIYQGFMLDAACKMAFETSQGRSDVLSWDPDVWVTGFSLNVGTSVQLAFDPETKEKLKACIVKLLADRAKYQKLERSVPLINNL